METLQEGIAELKRYFSPLRGTSSSRNSKTLQEAAHRLFAPFACSHSQPLRIHVLEFDSESLSSTRSLLAVLGESPSTSSFLPIRMDAEQTCIDFQSTILLYNFALSNLLLSRSTDGESRERMLANSMNLVQLASSIIAKRSSNSRDGVEEALLLELGLLVFHIMMQILIDAGEDLQASMIYERYMRIRAQVTALQSSEWYQCTSKTTAAAA